jgi:hypothetical protein
MIVPTGRIFRVGLLGASATALLLQALTERQLRLVRLDRAPLISFRSFRGIV